MSSLCSNIYFSFQRKDDKFKSGKDQIEITYLKELISRIKPEDRIKKLTTIFTDAVFADYNIAEIVLFSYQSCKVPDHEADGMQYYNPLLEELLENLGYDLDENMVNDNSMYLIQSQAFLSFTLEDIDMIMASDSVSEMVIYLAEQ